MQKHIPIAVAGAVLVVAGGVFGATQAFAKEVTLVVDGQTQKVRTWDSQVSEVLAGKKIAVNEHDVVTPAPQESLKDKSTITVSYGRELRVTINGKEQVHWTTATNVNDALAALQLRGGENARISVSRSAPIGREGLAFSLDVPTRVTVVAGGKSQDVDAAGDVNAALAAAGITVDADDIVTPERTTPLTGDMKIKVVKVETKTVTEDVDVPFAVTKVDDATLEKGQTKVKVAGVNGSSKVTFDVVMHDGKVVSKTKKSEAAGTEAKPQTLLVGTKAPAPAKPIDTSGSGEGSINWDKLAQCEAGGNWATNTGNGYYGGLQFSAQTWAGFGGTKYAATANLASKAQQIEIGEKVLKSQGLKAWPGCTAKGMY